MRLLSLSLEQYRNYGRLAVDFPSDDLHLFIGQNGSGKTNILEAISLLSLTKSFLGLDEQDLRQWGTEFYRVTGKIRSDSGEEQELEVVSQLTPRKLKGCLRNSVRIPIAEMVGLLPAVTFLPQDLSLFTGSPSERRRYFDQLLCQVSPGYFRSLMTYQRVLKQRNTLLRELKNHAGDIDALDPWDAQLAEHGSVLITLRRELTETFNLTIADEVRALGELWERVSILYDTSTDARDQGAIGDELHAALMQNRQRDVLIQSTTVGPHRDDWTVIVDERPLITFASRGQQRVVVLALLFLEASYLELRRGEKPVILLDDIFSELDENHRERLLKIFSGHQVFLTATELPGEGSFPGVVKEVSEGKLVTR